jgi:hypothetical protein
MFASLMPGLVVAAITILMLRLVFGFLLSPPRKQNFRTRLIRFVARMSVRLERFLGPESRRKNSESGIQNPEETHHGRAKTAARPTLGKRLC